MSRNQSKIEHVKKQPFDRIIPYNQLPVLPPDFQPDSEVLLKWGYASRELAELNRNLLRLPNPAMLVNTLSLQEAKSSSEIENIFTTDDELYKALSDTVKEDNANPATKEVLRYREALWAGYNDVANKGSMDIDVIIKIYQKVKDSAQGLRPPQSHVVIRRGESEFRSGEVIYTPPKGKDILEEKLENLLQYMNDDELYPQDPLIKMAIAHYQFEAIHPFSDGNGRTGRILNLLFLANKNLLKQPILYLSKYIIEHKEDYYYHLNLVTQRQAWKEWLLYMLTAVEQTARRSNQIIDDIIAQMAATLEYGKAELKWYNKEINEVVFSQPYLKARTIGESLGKTSRTTLTKYMADLASKGILTAKQDGKEVFYVNSDLVRILE